jgi:hypothetical protein
MILLAGGQGLINASLQGGVGDRERARFAHTQLKLGVNWNPDPGPRASNTQLKLGVNQVEVTTNKVGTYDAFASSARVSASE